MRTVGRVALPVVFLRALNTVGRVVAAGCVDKERLKTVGRVVVAGGVASERTRTGGRVGVAGGVATERIENRWPYCCRRL